MLNILFPDICNGCNHILSGNEAIICTQCRHQLPVASFHKYHNPTFKNIFQGKIPVEQATALLYFQKKGITQELLHNLKYRGQEQIGEWLGKWLGAELKQINAFNDIDMVIPVPLHPKRKRKRGYNQVTKFGQEIANALSVSYNETNFIKIENTDSQVFKKRNSRFSSAETKASHFKVVDDNVFNNKHILLVDDIITTGATLEACATQLIASTQVKISFATMAITSS